MVWCLRKNSIKLTAMCNFIEDYLQNPTLAVANAKADADKRFCSMLIDDSVIYDQIATSEYHLYEAIAI